MYTDRPPQEPEERPQESEFASLSIALQEWYVHVYCTHFCKVTNFTLFQLAPHINTRMHTKTHAHARAHFCVQENFAVTPKTSLLLLARRTCPRCCLESKGSSRCATRWVTVGKMRVQDRSVKMCWVQVGKWLAHEAMPI